MTKLLDEAIQTASHLPSEQQDALAHMIMLYADMPMIQLTPEEEADLAEADAEIVRGEFATDEEMNSIWTKPRP